MSDQERPLEPESEGYLGPSDALVGDPPDPASLAQGYETDDTSPRAIARFGLILLVVVFVVAGVLIGLFNLLENRAASADRPLSPLVDVRPTPPGPLLQPNPAMDWSEMRAQQEALLGSYGWVDQEGGVARIPIDAAIERLLDEGLPARPLSEGDGQ